MRRLLAAGAALVVLGTAAPALATPGPADAPEYWFDRWNVTQLWASGARGQGIVIAEIDTGVNASLPQLSGRVLPGHDFGDSGGDGRTDRDVDQFGHGTAMASIMVARPGPFDITGLAPGAKILPIAVPLIGTTDEAPDDRLPQAIRWAVDHGADVINMSLGGSRTPGADRDSCPAEEQAAIYYALNKGAVLVAAVGNSGPTKNTIEEPGVCLGVISVGAVDASGTVADFSSRQPYLTMTAPGVNVPSLSRVDDEGYSGDGTSQATAIVSAVVALTWSKHRSASGRDIVTRLLNTLDDRRQTPSSAYGYGIVDGYRAVTAAVSAGAPNPVYDAVTPFLARANATSAKLVRPHAAARGELGAGGYAVHPPHWYTDTRIVGGLSSAGAGLLVLGMLLLVGLRARRRQPVARPAPLPPVPAPMPYQLPGVVIQPWPPRPLPAPRPGAPGDPGQ